jgi:hypothetical protein
MLTSDEVSTYDLNDARLHQGDIFRWEKPDGTEWTEHGVVITADCDLVHNKMRGRVSYVPILRFETYISRIWGVNYVEKRVAKTLEGAIAAIRRAHQERGHARELTESAVRDWIERDQPKEIADLLLSTEYPPRDRKNFEERIRAAKEAVACQRMLAEPDLDRTYCDRLAREFHRFAPDVKGDPLKAIEKALNDHCSSLPGDVFFISCVPGDSSNGYFCLLRHVTQRDLIDISLDPIRRLGPVLPYRRIARLNAPYVYALTQNLARVFADIGLPSHHSTRISDSVQRFLRTGVTP